MEKLANKIFDGRDAENKLEEYLFEAGVLFEGASYDDYDCSMELFDVPPSYRLPEEAQKIIYDAGFYLVFVNHTDKWETHYRFNHKNPFEPQSGWRVSYPSKRGEDNGAILVEEKVEGWPEDWFETGKVKIVGVKR